MRLKGTMMLMLAGAFVLAGSAGTMAQYVPGPGEEPSAAAGLDAKALGEIQGSLVQTPALRAAQNALAATDLQAVVTDLQKARQQDTLFTHVITAGKITNQEQTGRCWLFAGLNVLRPAVMAKYKLENFEFSQAYSQFYDKLERANRTLELAIALRNEPPDSRKNALLLKDPVPDGGDWNYVLALVDKYGLVPKSVMPDTWSASHTDAMNALLDARVRKGIVAIRKAAASGADVARLRQEKMAVLKDVYRILVLCLGEPPRQFTWRYEDKDHKVSEPHTYTPQSFYKEWVGVSLHDYLRFVNYPGKPMHVPLRFAWNRDMADAPDMQAVNVTTDKMESMAMKSILADEAVWFCCNSSVQRDNAAGLWDEGIQDYSDLFGVNFSMDKADALAYLQDAPNHCMVFIGVNVTAGKPDKWKVENSWGDKRGREGYWTITSSWFDAHVFEMLVNRKFVPPELAKLADQKPVVLPPWDPFSD